jgi:predicted RNA binding protein YcfA (HicA-like mRNA interferase family)
VEQGKQATDRSGQDGGDAEDLGNRRNGPLALQVPVDRLGGQSLRIFPDTFQVCGRVRCVQPRLAAELTRRLRELGFDGPYSGGNHLFMVKGDLRLTIPNPQHKEIGSALLSRLLRQVGIERDDWISKS